MSKQREEFEAWFEKKFTDLHDAILCGDLVAKKYRKTMWQAWQQAQKVAVPDGFVVVRKDLIKTLHEELLDHEPDSFVVNRDICELWKQAEEQVKRNER